VKHDTVWNEKASNVFLKEREQYIKIQDLKAQQQDKNIAISELKKLIEKYKGKSVETKFDKLSVIWQPNAQRIPKPLVLEGLSKAVTAQTLPQTARQVFAPILDYGDLFQGNITINKVYYVEGLNHNLFSVGQFCDADLEVAFCKSTCFVRDLQNNNLLIDYDKSDPVSQLQNVSSSADAHVPSQQELDLLFSPLYDEFFTAVTLSVNKYSSPTNNSNQQDTQPTTNIQPTSSPSTPTYVHAEDNNDNQAEEEHLQDDEFTNPFCTPVQEVVESSSHNIDPEMCMFALTVSTAEPKNIKEAMADSAWIEVMQEELHQFDKLQVWELVDKPFGKIVIRLKWLWKNKKDEDQTDTGMSLTAYANADLAGCQDTRRSTSGSAQFLEAEYVGVICKLCSSNVDENTTSRLWLQLQQNTVVL
nr:integrase, catalytic region, zinc finger, CCHC-type, peptidase aspartic, catalytic [Tanacetum cinerariifolium]